VMIAGGSVWSAYATTAWELIVANGLFIGLLGTSAFFTPLMANTTRWFNARRGVAVGIVSAGQSLGGAVWPPVHSHLSSEFGWRNAYLAYAVLAVALCLPLAWLLRGRAPNLRATNESKAHQGLSGQQTRFELKISPVVLQVALCVAIVGFCVAMSMPMVHIIAHSVGLGHPEARAAEILAVLLFTSFISRILWGMLADRIGGLLTLFVSSGSQAVMLCALLSAEGLLSLYVVGGLYGLAFGGIVPMYSVIVREYFPVAQLGWRIGIIYLFGTGGMALGGVLGGLVFDVIGNYTAAFAIGIGFNVVNLVLIAGLLFRERPIFKGPTLLVITPPQITS